MRRAPLLSIALALVLAAPTAAMATTAPTDSAPVTDVSSACADQNAEVVQAVDYHIGYVYELWIGCDGIGFARSTDGGRHFDAPFALPGTAGNFTWDPAIAVAPNGTVYASYMIQENGYMHPVVAASFDHGATFPQDTPVIPPVTGNWGDRDYIAVSATGTVYLTWDYGPSAAEVKLLCAPTGSCAFSNGDFNIVIQKSTDGGRSFGGITPVSPGFPLGGADSGPLLVEPNGRIDVELWRHATDPATLALSVGYSYFTSSADGGRTWSRPVLLGSADQSIALPTWWIDGAIGSDAAGDLYVVWDTQSPTADIGWLVYSTNHGRTWSRAQRVTPDNDGAVHLLAVAGGPPGVAYVGELTDNSGHGYAQFLRTYVIGRGWLTEPRQVSVGYGADGIWPGDTIGISAAPFDRRHPEQRVMLSWGSAVGTNPDSEIYVTTTDAGF